MTFSLRPYQETAISEVRGLMRQGQRSILLQAPTGAGKTAQAVYMLGTAQAQGRRCLFAVHRRELLRQSAAMFETVGVPYGVIAADFTPPRGSYLYHHNANIQIANVQTLVKRLPTQAPFDMIVWDEAHHTVAGMWKKIRAANRNAWHVGLTATPWRLDGKGLRDHFGSMVLGPTVPWLIQNGFLSPYELYAPPGVSLSGLRKVAGDFTHEAAAGAVDKPSITGDILAHYLAHAAGRRVLGFAASVEHSKHLVERFNDAGIPSAHVDANTASDLRDGIFADLRSGALLAVFNVDLAGEGFDCPAVEAVILARPTCSLALYLQQVGRALRPCDGKDRAIILDHAGNSAMHGLPDAERVWSLDGVKGENGMVKDPAERGPRTCPVCFRAQIPGRPTCRYCGAEFPIKSREIDERAGTLERVQSVAPAPQPATVPAVKRTNIVDNMSEAEMVDYFQKIGYPRPRLVARDIARQRALHQALQLVEG